MIQVESVIDVADKALKRLGAKSYRMKQGTKPPNKIVTALARELAGFLWAAARLSTTPPGARFPDGSRQVKSSERSSRIRAPPVFVSRTPFRSLGQRRLINNLRRCRETYIHWSV